MMRSSDFLERGKKVRPRRLEKIVSGLALRHEPPSRFKVRGAEGRQKITEAQSERTALRHHEGKRLQLAFHGIER